MIGGVSTICGECSYRWILSPTVARSWFCPRCGGPSGPNAAEYICLCGHLCGVHRVRRVIPPSRVAFGMAVGETERLSEIIATEPEPTPEIGTCTVCDCVDYRLLPPILSSIDCLEQVARIANRGSNGREIKVDRIDTSTVRFIGQSGSVVVARAAADSITLQPADPGVSIAIFKMGACSVSDIVVAIIASIKAKPGH